jgi:hypothetical protein
MLRLRLDSGVRVSSVVKVRVNVKVKVRFRH